MRRRVDLSQADILSWESISCRYSKQVLDHGSKRGVVFSSGGLLSTEFGFSTGVRTLKIRLESSWNLRARKSSLLEGAGCLIIKESG